MKSTCFEATLWKLTGILSKQYSETDPLSGVFGIQRETSRFTAKEWDEETKLYYMSARYQNPMTSRWMSADPAGSQLINPMRDGFNLIESQNWYCYVGNNPVIYVDPSGEAIALAPAVGIGILTVGLIVSVNTDQSYKDATKDVANSVDNALKKASDKVEENIIGTVFTFAFLFSLAKGVGQDADAESPSVDKDVEVIPTPGELEDLKNERQEEVENSILSHEDAPDLSPDQKKPEVVLSPGDKAKLWIGAILDLMGNQQ